MAGKSTKYIRVEGLSTDSRPDSRPDKELIVKNHHLSSRSSISSGSPSQCRIVTGCVGCLPPRVTRATAIPSVRSSRARSFPPASKIPPLHYCPVALESRSPLKLPVLPRIRRLERECPPGKVLAAGRVRGPGLRELWLFAAEQASGRAPAPGCKPAGRAAPGCAR